MKFLLLPFVLLWKLWVLFLAFFVAVPLSPIIIGASIVHKEFSYPYRYIRLWAVIVFYLSGFTLEKEIKEKLAKNKSYIFIANHSSVIDILMAFIYLKNHPIVFIGKKEATKYPVVGYIYKKFNIIVDRADRNSKMKSLEKALSISKEGKSLFIFPEGLVPEDESIILSPFKMGAFSISIYNNIPIVPLIFIGGKELFPFTYLKGRPGKVKLIQEKPVYPSDFKNGIELKKYCYNLLLQELSR